ncbi:hypothetical protein ACDQ55_21365 [Chitinophaga sp. 30R24]|uniref:hypothetical protein n=1 Tax=Chitinophaga sp. 30R24 TaxID=3248838 RepID=UPI003B8F7791
MEDIKVKVLGRLSNKMFNLYKDVLDVKENDVVFFCDYSEFDIPVGYCFTGVVKSDNTILGCKIRLKSVSQQFLKLFDEIPHGWKTIGNFEFIDGIIPDEVQMLPLLDDWIYSEKYLLFQ